MTLFSKVITIDWSGSENPFRTKSISVAFCDIKTRKIGLIHPADGGLWSRTLVFEYLCKLKKESPTFIGIDFNFAYAQSVAQRQFGASYSHQDLWAAVDQASAGDPNFFAKGFWAHPRYGQPFWCQGPKPKSYPNAERLTENACRAQGLGHPESPFKLIGPKQVGKGGLAGMRMLHHLKQKRGDYIAIWPFEDVGRAPHIVAEIYPRLFLRLFDHKSAKVRGASAIKHITDQVGLTLDIDQTTEITDHSADALISAAGIYSLYGRGKGLQALLQTPLGKNKHQISREGWIFGVKIPA